MAKPHRPRLSWFRFYADDFLGGTGALTAPECGRYLLLLLHQWGTKERQVIPADADRLRVICRGEDPGGLVLSKFTPIEGGFRNQRLAVEWEAAQREYTHKSEGGGTKIPGQIPPQIPPQTPGRNGSPTKNQEPRTIERKRTSAPARGDTPLAWSREACDAWNERFGGMAPGGQIGKALKPLVDRHGWEIVRQAWVSYLRQVDADFASPSRFASTYGRWSGTVPPGAPPGGGKAGAEARTMANMQAWVAGKESK